MNPHRVAGLLCALPLLGGCFLNAFFWTATRSTTALEQYSYQLNTTHGGLIPGSNPEDHAYAVRCLKD